MYKNRELGVKKKTMTGYEVLSQTILGRKSALKKIKSSLPARHTARLEKMEEIFNSLVKVPKKRETRSSRSVSKSGKKHQQPGLAFKSAENINREMFIFSTIKSV